MLKKHVLWLKAYPRMEMLTQKSSTGACLQSILTLILPFRYAFLPAFILLIGQVINTILISQNIINNPYMRNARIGKHTAQIPNADGTVSQRASDKGVVIFLLGAVSHRYINISRSLGRAQQ